MKLTKYTHACLVVELQNHKLIIDPGTFTTDLADTTQVSAVVVTHEHGDHFDPERLQAIIAQNPDVRIFTTQTVADQINDKHVAVAAPGTPVTVGPFTLQFYGEHHAPILPQIPVIKNVGVMVNEQLFYPGDAFTTPGTPVPLLALPACAPWLKTSDAIAYLEAVKPQRCFLTHDALLSEQGQGIYSRLTNGACEQLGVTFEVVKPGDSLEV